MYIFFWEEKTNPPKDFFPTFIKHLLFLTNDVGDLNDVHVNDVHVNDVHVNNVHVNDVHVNDVHINDHVMMFM